MSGIGAFESGVQAAAVALAVQPWRTVGLSVLAVWLLGAAAGCGWRRSAPGVQLARAVALTVAAGGAALVGLLWWAWPQANGLVGRFDEALVQALASGVSPQRLQVWGWLTHAGDALWITALAVIVAGLLAWQRSRVELQVWLGGLIGNALVTRGLKALVERQRPQHHHGLAVLESFSSFPSGHASASVVAWGLLAWLLMRRLPRHWHAPLALAAAAIVVSVGWSRVLLQVHYASDVLAGWLTGGSCLAACLLAANLLAARHPSDASGRRRP